MAKRQVFYSFHYGNDVMRVSQIRNIGIFEGNSPVSSNEWEEVKRKGDTSIESWIDGQMQMRSCVVVFIGEETASRHWVLHEIKRAWELKKGLVGIYIHNLQDPKLGKCNKGENPFDKWNINGKSMSNYIKCYNPRAYDAYGDIKENLDSWIEEAISTVSQRP